MKKTKKQQEAALFLSPPSGKSSWTQMEILHSHSLSVLNIGRKKMRLASPLEVQLCQHYLAESLKRKVRFLPTHVLKKTCRAEGLRITKLAIKEAGIGSYGRTYPLRHLLNSINVENNKSAFVTHMVNKMASSLNTNREAPTS